MNEWKQICCAVDFSDHSFAALRRALDLAHRLGAELTLLHVCLPGPRGSLATAERALSTAEERTLARLEEWRGVAVRELGRDVQARLLVGNPARELARHAAHGMDLLVVGTRGPTGLGRLLLGSVAERVVRDAPCPVMVVHLHDRRPEQFEAPDLPPPGP